MSVERQSITEGNTPHSTTNNHQLHILHYKRVPANLRAPDSRDLRSARVPFISKLSALFADSVDPTSNFFWKPVGNPVLLRNSPQETSCRTRHYRCWWKWTVNLKELNTMLSTRTFGVKCWFFLFFYSTINTRRQIWSLREWERRCWRWWVDVRPSIRSVSSATVRLD